MKKIKPSTLNTKIGEVLKANRVALGLTQVNVGKMMARPHVLVGLMEDGRSLTIPNIQSYASVLGTTPSAVLKAAESYKDFASALVVKQETYA